MRIYTTAKTLTDLEKWILHGVDPSNCREMFKGIKEERKQIQQKASEMAEALGHKLFRNWTVMNTNRCRKCGMMISTPNVLAKTSLPDVVGAAIQTKCNVNLDNVPEGLFEKSDEILDNGVPLNGENLDTII